jgi:hypothetical protein
MEMNELRVGKTLHIAEFEVGKLKKGRKSLKSRWISSY